MEYYEQQASEREKKKLRLCVASKVLNTIGEGLTCGGSNDRWCNLLACDIEEIRGLQVGLTFDTKIHRNFNFHSSVYSTN